MSEKKEYSQTLTNIGTYLSEKRKSLGRTYKNREAFIDLRSEEVFGGYNWISPIHLANIELGKNWISIEKLILLADALEEDPVVLFSDIVDIYKGKV